MTEVQPTSSHPNPPIEGVSQSSHKASSSVHPTSSIYGLELYPQTSASSSHSPPTSPSVVTPAAELEAEKEHLQASMIPLPSSPPHYPSTRKPHIKSRIPSRRPKGWKSTTTTSSSRQVSGVSSIAEQEIPGTRIFSSVSATASNSGRNASGERSGRRVISGIRVASGGRRISGALQYALMPSPTDSTTPSSLPAVVIQGQLNRRVKRSGRYSRESSDGTAIDSGNEGSGSPNSSVVPRRNRSSSPTGTTQEYSSDEEPLLSGTDDDPFMGEEEDFVENEDNEGNEPIDRDQVHDMTGEIIDPEWMGYVRTQLAALFPDFQNDNNTNINDRTFSLQDSVIPDVPNGQYRSRPTPRRPAPLHLDSHTSQTSMPRLVSDSSTLSSISVQTPNTWSSPSGIGMEYLATPTMQIQDQVQRTIDQSLVSGNPAGIGNGEGGTVREEITAMREEMERLRSFVGELAGNRGAATDVSMGENRSSDTQRDSESEIPQNGDEHTQIPTGMMNNLPACIKLLKSIHQAIHQLDDQPRDEEIFTPENIAYLQYAVDSRPRQ